MLTFLHGFGFISNEALNFLLWLVVSIVRGRLGPFGASTSFSSTLLSSSAVDNKNTSQTGNSKCNNIQNFKYVKKQIGYD